MSEQTISELKPLLSSGRLYLRLVLCFSVTRLGDKTVMVFITKLEDVLSDLAPCMKLSMEQVIETI